MTTNLFLLTVVNVELLNAQDLEQNVQDALWAGRPYLTLLEAFAVATEELLKDYEEMEIGEPLPKVSDWAVGLPPVETKAVASYELEDEPSGKCYLIRHFVL